MGAADQDVIKRAVTHARRRNPLTPASVFDFIRSVLLLEEPEGLSEVERGERREFVMKFQQLTGPVMAKGVEDTAFYRYFPLAALGEVGGHPESLGVSLAQFHREMEARAASYPHALSATDTHDAKRSEDARARLAVLSEISREWRESVAHFRACNLEHKSDLGDGLVAPDNDDEYLFYQTVLGIWPPGVNNPPADLVQRVSSYMSKAVHEAKRHSSWINPNRAYDDAVSAFVEAALDPQRGRPFLSALARLRQRVERPGLWNSLTQTLVKVTAPGVPDFYQGTELMELQSGRSRQPSPHRFRSATYRSDGAASRRRARPSQTRQRIGKAPGRRAHQAACLGARPASKTKHGRTLRAGRLPAVDDLGRSCRSDHRVRTNSRGGRRGRFSRSLFHQAR